VKLTKNQTAERTLTDLYRAMDRQQPVTITYTKADGTETIRTIEAYDIRTTTKGDVIIKAMDRASGESRTFRADRIQAYTTHRTAYVVPREQPTTARPVITTPAAFTAYEIARDDRKARHLATAA
jgi:predicted DNA-binding transcriptional regulator YafY